VSTKTARLYFHDHPKQQQVISRSYSLFEELSGKDIKKYPKLRKLRISIEKIMINTD
jgi:hypothetical protein